MVRVAAARSRRARDPAAAAARSAAAPARSAAARVRSCAASRPQRRRGAAPRSASRHPPAVGGLEGLGGLVALRRCLVAGARRQVALGGRRRAVRPSCARAAAAVGEPLVGAPCGGPPWRLCSTRCPRRRAIELAVRRGLIEVRGLLVPIGAGLVAVATAPGRCRRASGRSRPASDRAGPGVCSCVLTGASIAGGAGAFAVGHGEPLSWSCRPRKPGGTPWLASYAITPRRTFTPVRNATAMEKYGYLTRVEAGARATRVVAGVRPPRVGVEVDVVLSPLVLQGADDGGSRCDAALTSFVLGRNDTLRIAD